jgi:hypothetical protein
MKNEEVPPSTTIMCVRILLDAANNNCILLFNHYSTLAFTIRVSFIAIKGVNSKVGASEK